MVSVSVAKALLIFSVAMVTEAVATPPPGRIPELLLQDLLSPPSVTMLTVTELAGHLLLSLDVREVRGVMLLRILFFQSFCNV